MVLMQNGYNKREDSSWFFFAFTVVFDIPTNRAYIRLTLDLLKSNVGVHYFSIVLVYS